MAILSILFIFLTLSTLVFKSSAKIRVSDLIKLFLTLSSPRILSKSSCSLFVRFSMKSKGPSVESSSSCYSDKYSLSSLSTSSKRNGASISISFYLDIFSYIIVITPFHVKNIWLWHIFVRLWPFLLIFYLFFILKCSELAFSGIGNSLWNVIKTYLKLANFEFGLKN